MLITKRKYITFTLLLVFGFLSSPHMAYCQGNTLKSSKLIFFYSPRCHNCLRVAKEMTRLTGAGFKDNIEVEYLNVDAIKNYKLLLSLEELYKSKIRNILPVVYFKGHFINGRGDIKRNLKALLNMPATAVAGDDSETLPKIDLVKRFNSFTLPAIIVIGLVDGVNPCAITVIVFFMSFLAFHGYQKREIAVTGLVFILSVYLTYCLMGLGIFESLYRLKGFWLLTKTVNITVGIISIIFGFCALHDFIQYRKTGSTDGLMLSLPRWIKNLIHRIIGAHYRGGSKAIAGLVISALITGFLVSILEAVCVAKIYLPTIVFVLKTTGLKLKAIAYLLLYNLLFVVPLLIIFTFAITGTSVVQFQKVLRGHLGIVKILMGVVFLVLGIFLIWKA